MKKALIIILILVALILLFPIREQAKDGGSVRYSAILYDVYKVHCLYGGPDTGMLYVEGIIVEFLGHQVYNNTNPHIENFGDSPDLEKNSDTDKETKIVIDRDAVTKIEIKRYRYNASAEETRTVTVTEEASINHIVDNLTSLNLKAREHGGQSGEPIGLKYRLYFYNTDEEIIVEVSISLDGLVNYHSVISGELDEAYIAGLFE